MMPGDIVSCSFKGCTSLKFVVVRTHSSNACYSGVLVVAHLIENPDREIRGTVIDGVNYGIDSSYFEVIQKAVS